MADAPRPDTRDPVVLQDWVPMAHALDWQLGQLGWQLQGGRTFLADDVPGIDTQGGLHGRRLAQVLFAHCGELDAAGALEPMVEVMELGMGTGLCALALLDRFQALCREQGKDWYDRLTFYATDATPRMVADARDRGVFDRHAGHVVLGLVDALDPARLVRIDNGESVDLTGRLRAVCHVFLLSAMPANLFQRRRTDAGEVWSVVLARTLLHAPERVAEFTLRPIEALVQAAREGDAADRLPLATLYPLIRAEFALVEVDLAEVAEAPELRALAGALDDAGAGEDGVSWVLHSAGARRCLELSKQVLRPDGVQIYGDFGPLRAARASQDHLYRRAGAVTTVPVNHFDLDLWGATPDGAGSAPAISVPAGDHDAAVKSRLLARASLPRTRTAFLEAFDPAQLRELDAGIARARQATDTPLEAWRAVLWLDPENEVLLAEAAEVALRQVGDAEIAHALLTEVLRLDPWYAPAAWLGLGDLLRATGEPLRARQAYASAVEAHPDWYPALVRWAEALVATADPEAALAPAARAVALGTGTEQEAEARTLLESAVRACRQRRVPAPLP